MKQYTVVTADASGQPLLPSSFDSALANIGLAPVEGSEMPTIRDVAPRVMRRRDHLG
jgi:hypothetical protein